MLWKLPALACGTPDTSVTKTSSQRKDAARERVKTRILVLSYGFEIGNEPPWCIRITALGMGV